MEKERAKSSYSSSMKGRTKSKISVKDVKEEESEDTNRISNGPNVYQIGVRIGQGAFGEVFQAFNSRTGDLVAVKRFPLNSIEQESLNSIEGEVELMQRLNHPNIVKYIETIRTRAFLYIVLEYMENGSLSNVINKFGSLTESLTAMFVTQILKGLKYLHDQGVLHRDIKGANILTTKDGLVKLADFGVAIKLSDAKADEPDIVGTPYWMAPEIIEGSTPTPACDIWSVGCIIIELLTGKPPFYDLQPQAAIYRIVTDEYPPFPEGISQALRDFLFNCFRKEPIMRSSAAKLLEHPWLHNSSTNSNLERHSTILLGSSRSTGSREGGTANNEADGVLNAIRMFQRESTPSNPSQSEEKIAVPEGIAMREIKVDPGSTSLSHDQSTDDAGVKRREAKIAELRSENPPLLSPTLRDASSGKFELPLANTNRNPATATAVRKNEEAKEPLPVENLVNRGLFRNQSDNNLIKRILSSDASAMITVPPQIKLTASPDRDCKTPESNPVDYAVRKLSSIGSRAEGKKLTPKSSFKSMKAISEDSADSWDVEIVSEIKSNSNDSTIEELQSTVRRIDLAAVKKGFISNTSFQRETIGRRIPSSTNVLRTKSTISLANSMDSIRNLQKGPHMLSPHSSSYLLQKYQEKPEEETYDDLLEPVRYTDNTDPFDSIDENMSSADTQDRNERSIQTHIPLRSSQKNSNTSSNTSTMEQKRVALEALQTMSSEDYDDLFDDSEKDGAAPNFANKLKQKLTNWSKELAEDDMDSFINNQFEEKDFQQDEQKDVHFRRSKEIVDLLNKIRPTMTNEEILENTNKILNLFDKFPEQRDHVITNHGVMPLMDMFEAKSFRSSESLRFEIYGYNVLRILNKIVEGSVRAQEQLSLVGIIPSIINFFERSCRPASPKKTSPNRSLFGTSPSRIENGVNGNSPGAANAPNENGNETNINSDSGELDPLAMEAARFIHTISISSSLTLQMLISAGGLSVLTTMASFGCKINSGTPRSTSSTHRRLHSWEELIKREELRRSEEEVEEILDVENTNLLSVQVTDRIYDSESKSYIEIFQMGMDCISRVFAAQKSRTRDFCRLFVKFGLLTHLALAFENLMTIYKSFLQKSQQQQLHQQFQLHAENNSAFRLHKTYSDSAVITSSNNNNDDENSNNINQQNGLSHKRTGSGTTAGNISRSDSSASMEAGNIDNCSEALYAQAIAAVFFKFSRSDAIVAETMANIDKGVIGVILATLQAPELRSSETFGAANSFFSGSPGNSMILQNQGSGHRRTRATPQPAYLEIVELLLKCFQNLSMEPSAIEYLEKAGTMETLVPLLNGPISEKCKVYILPCIFNMCRINRKRLEQAAILGIVPHLKRVITEGSHLRQFALPIMFDLAHGNNIIRDVLWKNDCVEFYLDLLKENYWQTFALNSLTVWLSKELEKDNKVSNVVRLLIQPSCLIKLIEFFRGASKQTVEQLHKPLLDMMSKSKDLSCALSMSGVFVSSLVKRLHITKEAIVLRSLLKMLQLIHQNHPCPRQLVLDNNLYKLVKEFAQSETKVVVQQIANRLLADFQVSTLT